MHSTRSFGYLVVVASAIALLGCGGGGGGASGAAQAGYFAVLTSTIDPGVPGVGPGDVGDESGEILERTANADTRIPIELDGGYGGPYVIELVAGALPLGVTFADGIEPGTGSDPVTNPPVHLHHIVGPVREAGTFRFTIQIVDSGADPFLYAVKEITWQVAVGPVRIVASDPAWAEPGTLDEDGDDQPDNPLHPALKTTVYNTFATFNLVVAGGQAPYTCRVVDDPDVADDGAPPQFTDFAPSSCSLVGSPIEVKPPTGVSVFTVEATDATGATGRLTLQWRIDVPPLVLLTRGDALPDGKCGTTYSETVEILDGVPPFDYEWVQEDVDRDAQGDPVVDYHPPTPPTLSPPECLVRVTAADYPAPADPGPDYSAYRTPPEGIILGDQDASPVVPIGVISGIPRRRGDFHVVLHVASRLLPYYRGQQDWAAFDLHFDESEPPVAGEPAFGQDPAYTVEGQFAAAAPFSRLPEAEVGVAYNPDVATHGAPGLQLLAQGGVPQDGWTNGPHASEVVADATEVGGGYGWTADWDPPSDGDAFSSLPAGMEFLPSGVLRVETPPGPSALVRQGPQAVALTVEDEQLPVPHVESRTVTFSVGPDRVVITESSSTDSTFYGYANYWTQNDAGMRVRVCEPFTSSTVVRNLQASDLSSTTKVPATTGLSSGALAQLLSAMNDAGTAVDSDRRIDLLRLSVNPTGWWHDGNGLCTAGPRMGQHADFVKGYNYYGNGNYSAGNGSNGWVPNATCVELPDCTSSAVTADPSAGIYTDGGQLYAFTSRDFFGLFVVRRDGTIFVPCAFDRSEFGGFGDAWMNSYGLAQNSYLKMPSIAVSPDGRFAAMKLKPTETSFTDLAHNTPIVVFTLTGEQPFAGTGGPWSYQVVDTGAGGSVTNGGRFLYAPSLALTNRHLYYLCGNSDVGYDAAWHGHFIYRYEIADGSGDVTATATEGARLTAALGAAETQWTNTATTPMQTPFHKWENPTGLNSDQYGFDGANWTENSRAPMPFRASWDGRSMALIAGTDPAPPSTSPYTSFHSDVMSQHVWVDSDGAGVRRLSSVKRRMTFGGSRGYGLVYGPSSSYPNWGRFSGPAPQLEISDDGSKVAVVANRRPTTTSTRVSNSSSSGTWSAYREDVVAFRTDDDWQTVTEIQVTGADSGTSRVFGTTANWRFGSLAFTRDSKGLVFWGGCSSYYASTTTYFYMESKLQVGTLYACNLDSAGPGSTGVSVYGILATADGGSSAGITSSPYTTANPYAPTLSAGSHTADAGVIKPDGGFRSANGNFLYLTNVGALGSSEYATFRLVGANLRSVDASQSVNGHADFRAFAVGNWPTQRGFKPVYVYYPSYYFDQKYRYGFHDGGGLQIAAREGSTVFFATHWQQGSGYNTSYSLGGPVYPSGAYCYGGYLGQVHCFDANIGGNVQKATDFAGDTGSYTTRSIQHVHPSADGSRVAMIHNTYSTSYGKRDIEVLTCTRDSRLGPTGTILTTPRTDVLRGPARVCTSVSFDSSGDKIYYAAGTGTENQKTLYEASLLPNASGQLPTPRTIATGAWFEVLHSGR